MNSKVIVLSDETTNAVVNVSKNNPEYGYIRVQQVRTMIDDNGFLRRKAVSTLIHGDINELKAMNFYAGQELPGQIVIKEALEPFNAKSPERDLKVAGSTGIICTFEGAPIFRKTVYSSASNAQDTLIKHDNVDQLREAYALSSGTSSAINNARPTEDLSI